MSNGKLSYKKWMERVDQWVMTLIGISVYDLEDFNSRDLYEDGVSPRSAAETAISEDSTGYEFEDDPEFGEDEFELDY